MGQAEENIVGSTRYDICEQCQTLQVVELDLDGVSRCAECSSAEAALTKLGNGKAQS